MSRKSKSTINQFIFDIKKHIKPNHSALKQLYFISNYFREKCNGNCDLDNCLLPSINDIINQENPELTQHIRDVVDRIQNQLATLIEDGIEADEISSEINAMVYAKRIVTVFIGAFLMTQITGDNSYYEETADLIDHIITSQLKI